MNNNENQQQGQTPSFLKNTLGINIRSLGLHLHELKILQGSFENKPDLLALAESWMTESDDPENFNLERFQPIERFSRKEAKRRSEVFQPIESLLRKDAERRSRGGGSVIL